MNHQPYGLAGSLSAKVKGFMGLPRDLNVLQLRPHDVQFFKTEKAAAEKYFNKLLGN